MFKRLIILFIAISIILTGITIYPRHASAGGGFLDINIESPQQIIKDIWSFIKDVLLVALKQRLIANLTDRTVDWIQNAGNPRVVGSYYEDVFKESLNAALGDAALEIGAGELCSPIDWGVSLQLQLAKPQTLSERVDCTLSDVISNVEGGIESFQKSFETGGWVGYQEIMEPQNSRWGVALLTQEELLRRQSERQGTARYEAEVGQGFIGVKRCLQWKCVADSPQEALEAGCRYIGETISGNDYYSESPDLKPYSGIEDRPAGSGWRCITGETVSPGKMLGDAVAQNMEIEGLSIVNADDVAPAIAAIVNAAINRVIKEATEGISYAVGRSTATQNCDELDSPALQKICETNQAVSRATEVAMTPFKALVGAAEPLDSCLTLRSKRVISVAQAINCIEDAVTERKEGGKKSEARRVGKDCIKSSMQATYYVSMDDARECVQKSGVLPYEYRGYENDLIECVNGLKESMPDELKTALEDIKSSLEDTKTALDNLSGKPEIIGTMLNLIDRAILDIAQPELTFESLGTTSEALSTIKTSLDEWDYDEDEVSSEDVETAKNKVTAVSDSISDILPDFEMALEGRKVMLGNPVRASGEFRGLPCIKTSVNNEYSKNEIKLCLMATKRQSEYVDVKYVAECREKIITRARMEERESQ